jgi:hypothetical protein
MCKRALWVAVVAPQELLELKVRFGKLVGLEGTASTNEYGFGTTEETEILLRKRK